MSKSISADRAIIRPLKLWRAQVAATGQPHCLVRGCFSGWNLDLLRFPLFVPVLSWNWSRASQLWLGHGQHARVIRARDVCDFEDRIFDPSGEMGKSTSWRWDDYGLSCRKQGGQAGPDQRLIPQPHPIREPWLVHWGDGMVVGPAGNGAEPTNRHPPWYRHRAGWARAAGPSPDITRTLRGEDGHSCVHASLRRTCCRTPPRKDLFRKSQEKRIAEPGRAAEKWVPATPPCITILRGVAEHYSGPLWM